MLNTVRAVILPNSLTLPAEQALDLPYRLLGADRELQVLFSDGIPVLVHHHHGKKCAQCREEGAINVVGDGITNGDREAILDDLADDEEGGTKQDVADGPAVVQGAKDEDELKDDVDDDAGEVEDEFDDPEGGGFG